VRFIRSALGAAGLSAAVLAIGAPAAFAGLPSSGVTPNPSAPGTATTFTVSCGKAGTSATLFGASLGLADRIPMHSTASTEVGESTVTVRLPADIAAGTYRPAIACSNGPSGTVTLKVNPVPSKAPPTGDGTTATQTDTPLALVGFGILGLGVLTGGLALRRRAGSRA
jgi:hypothetical protein